MLQGLQGAVAVEVVAAAMLDGSSNSNGISNSNGSSNGINNVSINVNARRWLGLVVAMF